MFTKPEESLDGLPYFLKNVIFLPLSRSYIFRSRENLLDPGYFDLNNAKNFYIPTTNNASLGAWYIWPDHADGVFENIFEHETVIIYMHGNSLGETPSKYPN